MHPQQRLHSDGKHAIIQWQIFQVLHNIVQIYKTRCRKECSIDPMVYKMYQNIIQINTRCIERTLRGEVTSTCTLRNIIAQ